MKDLSLRISAELAGDEVVVTVNGQRSAMQIVTVGGAPHDVADVVSGALRLWLRRQLRDVLREHQPGYRFGQ